MPVLRFFWRIVLAVFGSNDVYAVVSYGHASEDAAKRDLMARLPQECKGCSVIEYNIKAYVAVENTPNYD